MGASIAKVQSQGFGAIARAVVLLLLLLIAAPSHAAITVNPASLPSGTVGTAYSRTFSATGGTTPYTYSVSAGSLPAGLTLNAATGVLAGTPTTATTSNFTIQATDRFGATGTRAYSVTINPAIVVNPATLPAWTLGTAYSQMVSATGGTGSYTFSRSAGTLPAGLALNASTGAITGTPTAAGTSNFTIRATDGIGAIGSRAYSVTIAAAIVVNPATLPGGTVGSAYSRTVTTTGGTGTKTFSVSAGALPTGLSLNAVSGVISGAPTSAGSSNFTIRATDSIGAIGARAYSVTINPAITLSPATLPNGTSGTPYSRTVSASGGTGTFTYSVSAGSLGAGLALNAATGVISGTPTTVGTRNFTIRATDGNATFGSQAYSITINAAITVNPATLANGTVGTPYSRTVSATGGSGSYTFSVSAGTLPAGLALNAANGVISGTPTASGASSFTVRATDTNGAVGARAYSVTMANPPVVVNPATLPGGAVGASYNQIVSATGGTGGGYTFSVSAGSLGAGLALNAATGVISGTPTTAGARNFTIRAQDSGGGSGTRAYSITINAAIAVSPASLPGGTVSVGYSQSVTASGGSGTFTYTISAGTLPAGLTLNASNGLVSGTPTIAGPNSFTMRATDGNGASGSRAYSVTITAAPIVINPATLPAATVGLAYGQTISATGGTGAKTFAVTAGSLPSGLSLNASTGAITGTPTSAATFNFTITATDTVAATGSRAYSITVSPAAALSIAPASLPATTQGFAYSQPVTASGGTAPYSYAVTAGSLPTGLSLNTATGAIAGTSSAAGSFNFTITATGSFGATGSRAYTVFVNASIAVNPASLPATTQGVAYSQSVSSTGGTGAVTFAVSAGSLPAGVSLNAASGAITGTPSAAGTFNFTITGTDTLGAAGSRGYTIVIAAALVVNPATLPNGTVGIAYAQTINATGGTGAVTFSITTGASPGGLSLNASSGALTGTPSSAATFTFTVTATDGVGATGSRTYTVTINPGITVAPASLPATTIGAAYSQSITAIGGNGTYTFSVSAGALPAGLALNASTGALTGTAAASGTFNFTVTATDGLGATGSRAYSLLINAAIAVSPASLPGGTVGGAYNQTLSTTGGTGTKTFAVTAGTLPTGVTLNATTGVISGTPTTAATSNFTVTATDTVGATGSRAYSVVINAAIVVNPAALPGGVAGTAYSQLISATGGNGSYTFSVSAGALPAGLVLNTASGLLSGTPSATGTANFTVTATDGLGATGSRAYSVSINAAITVNPATLPAAVIGTAYSQNVSATGGSGAFTYAISAGALPAGVVLNGASGLVSGTPTTGGTATFSVTATDTLGATGTRAYSVPVNSAMALNPATLPPGVVGTAYSQAMSATGGSGTYTYAVTLGTLPPGLSLNTTTGVLSGTATSTATSSFTITVTDTLGASAARSYSLSFNAAVTVGPATLPNPVVGTAYTQTVSGNGGTGSYAFTLAAGNLPPGLVLTTGTSASATKASSGSTAVTVLNAPTGALAGMPTAAGTYTFTITATDGLGFAGVRAYTLTVAPPTLVLVSPIGNGAVGSPYSQSLVVTGGTAPYTYSLAGGQLPPGLTLNPTTGALSGVPTASGTYTVTIIATDANGATGTFAQTIEVVARPDPTTDPGVRGIEAAQISAAARFGMAQIDNVGGRVRMLHLGFDPCSTQIDIGANIRWERTDSSNDEATKEAQKLLDERAKATKEDRSRCDRSFAVWAAGNVDFGFLRPTSAADRSDFRTSGLTLGADTRINERLIVGAALGFARDETDVDTTGTESQARAQSVSLYGSFAPIKGLYVDALMGYGGLSFDSSRWQATSGVLLSGDRNGSQYFGSLALSGVFQLDRLNLAPYVRADRVRSRLNGYAETGSTMAALSYGSVSVSENSAAVGVYAGYRWPVSGGWLEPGLRLEQRRVRLGGADQGVAYADMPQFEYRLQQGPESDDRTTAALSLLMRFGFSVTLGLEYSYTGSDTFRSESVRAVVRAPF